MQLRTDRISVSHGDITAVSEASLRINRGEFITLVGPNGAGKSSLLKGIAGLLPTCGGRVLLSTDRGDKDLTSAPAWDRVAMGIRYVPQERPVFQELTVFDNLSLALSHCRRMSKMQVRSMIDQALSIFPEIRDRGHQEASTLSGGEQRMLSLACAWVHRESIKITTASDAFLLLDEPAHGLAPAAIDRIEMHLRELRSRGMSVLCVEQSATFTVRLADRTYLMSRGTVSESRVAADILTSDFYTEYFGTTPLSLED